jgi:hypothetical protein
MASVRTNGVTFTTTAGVKTVVLTSAVGDLWIVMGAETGVTTTPTLTDDQAGGTYTLITSALKNTSADKQFAWVRNALFTSAVSTTVTFTPSGDTGGGCCVIAISGMSRYGLDAIRQNAKQENIASGTPAPVFTFAALTANLCIGSVHDATNGNSVVQPASWSELQDVGYNTPTTGLEVASRDSGETNSTITWGGAAASAFSAMALELDVTRILAPLLLYGQQYMRTR